MCAICDLQGTQKYELNKEKNERNIKDQIKFKEKKWSILNKKWDVIIRKLNSAKQKIPVSLKTVIKIIQIEKIQ